MRLSRIGLPRCGAGGVRAPFLLGGAGWLWVISVSAASLALGQEAASDSIAAASPAVPDSTAPPAVSDLLQQAIDAARDSSAVADSLPVGITAGPLGAAAARDLPASSLRQKLAPTMGADVEATITSIRVRGKLQANLPALTGSSGDVRYTATNTYYRQTDRDQEQRELAALVNDDLGGFGRLNVNLGRTTNFDENRLTNGQSIVLDYTSQNASLSLGSGRQLVDGFSHAWKLRASAEDVQQTNRGVANNRNLSGAGITSVWTHQQRTWNLEGRFGAERRTGTRDVLGRSADAKATRDTLATHFRLDLGRDLGLDLSAQRAAFIEERLDFARNASGVIDTASTNQKVGQERESTVTRSVEASMNSRPWRPVSLGLTAGSSFTQSEFAFSRQGVVQNGRNEFSLDGGLRYAAAGSLRVHYGFTDNYNDRRTTGSDRFRGRETRRNQSIRFSLAQRLLAASDLALSAEQSLDQNIFEEINNDNDRDRLIERGDAKITSRAIRNVKLDVGATISHSEDLNIAAARVNNNKEEQLIEVRGGYTWDPPSGLRLSQNYRLQIRFIDFFASDDRDQFNKQGQLSSRVDWDLAVGADLSFEYVVDFRRTGLRDPDQPFREVYLPDQRRRDQRVRASVTVPFRGFRFEVGSERGFLNEERGTRVTDENRGRVDFKVTGNRRLWANRAQLRVDVERVLQFGPRVREEQKDFWEAKSGLTVTF